MYIVIIYILYNENVGFAFQLFSLTSNNFLFEFFIAFIISGSETIFVDVVHSFEDFLLLKYSSAQLT